MSNIYFSTCVNLNSWCSLSEMYSKQLSLAWKNFALRAGNPTASYYVIAKKPTNFQNLQLRRFGKKINSCVTQKGVILFDFKQNPNQFVGDVAKELGISSSYNLQKFEKRNQLKTFKAQKIPSRDDKQNSVVKTRAKKLYPNLLTKPDGIIMDDNTPNCPELRPVEKCWEDIK